MFELPCKMLGLFPQLRLLVASGAVLLATGCAQFPGLVPAEAVAPAQPLLSDSASIVHWPTPAIADTPAPRPPEPTLLPQAERPTDRSPEHLRNTRRTAAAASGTADTGDAPRDVWQRIRSNFQMSALESKLVRDWETYYATRPEYFARMIENSRPFLFHIITEVERRGMPAEIALLHD